MKKQHPVIGSHIAEIELVYKSRIRAADRMSIKTSADTVNLLRNHWNADTIELFEEFKVLYLNRANKVIGMYPVSCGAAKKPGQNPICYVKREQYLLIKKQAKQIVLMQLTKMLNTPSLAGLVVSKRL